MKQEIEKKTAGNFIKFHTENGGNLYVGQINVCGTEEKSKQGQWVMQPCSEDTKDAVNINYSFHIEVTNDQRKVFENGGKIETARVMLCKTSEDMHINSDGSCCLGLDVNDNELTIEQFIENKVLPFFFWQAYFYKFGKAPQFGEFSHNKSKAIQELQEDVNYLRANDKCYCGSGNKYKKCCKRKQPYSTRMLIKTLQESNGHL